MTGKARHPAAAQAAPDRGRVPGGDHAVEVGENEGPAGLDREGGEAGGHRDLASPARPDRGGLLRQGSCDHNFNAIVKYQTGYNLFTMRQASRRAWRIGQSKDCRVYYLHYAETMQHRAMQLMARKMAAAMALDGELSAEGLTAMADDESAAMALARSISKRSTPPTSSATGSRWLRPAGRQRARCSRSAGRHRGGADRRARPPVDRAAPPRPDDPGLPGGGRRHPAVSRDARQDVRGLRQHQRRGAGRPLLRVSNLDRDPVGRNSTRMDLHYVAQPTMREALRPLISL